jgi:hypothetical protein
VRGLIVAAARNAAQPARAGWWPRPLLVGATVAVTLVGGVMVGRWVTWRDARTVSIRPQAASAGVSAPRRQLQFATPGGTRIIWVFDPDFNP